MTFVRPFAFALMSCIAGPNARLVAGIVDPGIIEIEPRSSAPGYNINPGYTNEICISCNLAGNYRWIFLDLRAR